jgi:hypothetical protein
MDAATRQLVIRRAAECCEYCRLPQAAAPFLTFHVEHIHAQQHVEDDSLDNLALACPDCNRHKGPNLTTFAPDSRQILLLFHPRQQRWEDHFEFQGSIILGRTETGTATIRLLQMNSIDRVQMRAELIEAGAM